MKKNLFIVLLLLTPFLGISQTTKPIDGFLGIKFGSSKNDVISAMQAKGAKLNSANSDESYLSFSNVKLGQRETISFAVFLIENKAYTCIFIFSADEEPRTIDYYNALVNDIQEIYGKGNSVKEFRSPFKYGDGSEITALSQGYADMFTDWKSGTNLIQASIYKDKNQGGLFVKLLYQDGTLADKAKAIEKQKAKSDF